MLPHIQKRTYSTLLFFKQHPAFLLAAYCLIIFGINLLFSRDLWVQDEMRYGEVVREMLTEGHWFIPHLNAHPYPDKPPLYFLLTAGLDGLIGNVTYSFRLLTFFSTALCVYGIYTLGNTLDDARTGACAGLLFCSTLLSLIVGHIVRMDMLLTATVVFAWIALLQYQRSWEYKHILQFWLICFAGIAVKGPIALSFTLLPAIAWFFYLEKWAGVAKLRLITGLSIIIGMVGLWLLAVILNGDVAYLETIWHEQLVGRTINSWSHREPIYFYVLLLPILLMPWTGLVASGLKLARKQHKAPIFSTLFFSSVPLITISLISGKLFIYLEPLIPACCIAAAWALSQLKPEQRTPYWLSLVPTLYYLLIAALCAYIAHYIGEQSLTAINNNAIKLIATAISGLALIQLFSMMRPLKAWLVTTLATSIVLSILAFGGVSTLINPLFSGRILATVLNKLPQHDTPIGIVHVTRGILNFYVGKTFQELDLTQANTWFNAHQDATIIIKTNDITNAFTNKNLMKNCHINQAFEVELKEYHVFSQCSGSQK